MVSLFVKPKLGRENEISPASGYKNEEEKLAMLTRLLPFIEKRLNLLELAPKGTGKSYVFGNVSKYGLLTDGGKITRSKMFYDVSRRAPGFIVGNDYVAIDEVKLVTFNETFKLSFISGISHPFINPWIRSTRALS